MTLLTFKFNLYLSGCQTISGPVPNASCVFPFRWDGVMYRECTSHHNNGQLWCPTQVDGQKNYIHDQWGNCAESCRGCRSTSGTPCQLPFIYNNVTHDQCVQDGDSGQLWCLTLDSRGDAVRTPCQPGCASKIGYMH